MLKPLSHSRPIRVLFVHFCGTKGGASSSLLHLVLALKPLGIEELILTPKGGAFEWFRGAGLRTEVIPEPSLFLNSCGVGLRGLRLITLVWVLWNLRSGPAIKKHLLRFDPDLVHL